MKIFRWRKVVSSENISVMPETEKGLFDHISDHPKLSGFLAFIAFAATFSPRVSGTAVWLCLLGAWVFASGMIVGVPRLCIHRWRKPISGALIFLVALGLVIYGRWLTGSSSVSREQFRLGKIAFSPPVEGKPPAVDIHYSNLGPKSIDLVGHYGLYVVSTGKIRGDNYSAEVQPNDVIELQEKIWSNFLTTYDNTDMSKASIVPPYRDFWTSAINRVPLSRDEARELSGNTQQVAIFLTQRFRWRAVGSEKIFIYDICTFIMGGPDVQFDCAKHNGPPNQP
jgi:hypothetical protein